MTTAVRRLVAVWSAVVFGLALCLTPAIAAPPVKPLVPGETGAFHSTVEAELVDGTITVDDGTSEVITTAFPPTGIHTFTRAKPGASFTDSLGTLTWQINYNTSPRTFQWGYTINPAVCGAATGPATHTQSLTKNGTLVPYHYSKADVYPCYFYHGSWKSSYLTTGATYKTSGVVTYPIPNGTATLRYILNWKLSL